MVFMVFMVFMAFTVIAINRQEQQQCPQMTAYLINESSKIPSNGTFTDDDCSCSKMMSKYMLLTRLFEIKELYPHRIPWKTPTKIVEASSSPWLRLLRGHASEANWEINFSSSKRSTTRSSVGFHDVNSTVSRARQTFSISRFAAVNFYCCSFGSNTSLEESMEWGERVVAFASCFQVMGSRLPSESFWALEMAFYKLLPSRNFHAD